MAIELVDHWYPLGDGTSANEWQSNTEGTRETQSALSVQANDIILVHEFGAAAQGFKFTPSGGGLTYNYLGSEPTNWGVEKSVTNANESGIIVWSATATETTSFKIAVASESGASSTNRAIVVKVIRGATGLGVVKFASGGEATSQPSTTVTTEGSSSWLSCTSNDWQAGNPALPTWESTGAGTGTMDVSHRDESAYNVYVGHFAEPGAAGSKTIKLSGTERWQMSVIELLGEEEKTQEFLPDEDLATTGWTETPLWSKLNDGKDETVVKATLA